MKKRLLSIFLFLALISTSVVPLYAIDEDMGENLAYGKTVWASDQYSDSFKAENVVDGKLNTSWASGSTVLNGPSGKYYHVTVDLGNVYKITSFTARSRRDSDQGYNRAGWLIHFSNDPDFQTFEEVGRKIEAGEYKSDVELNFEQSPKAYRYVRVAHEKRSNLVVAEIEVYGEPYLGEERIQFSDTEGKLSDSANLLKSIGVMDAFENTKFMPDMLMSRSEALDVVLKATGYTFGEKETAVERAVYAEKMGIISSAQDFRPNNYVTVQEYKKMMLAAMGYSKAIEHFGGWPRGVYEVQTSLGWLKATQQAETDYASRGSIANITYYALTSPVYSMASMTDKYFEMHKGELLLKKAFGLTLYEGVVTANSVTNLSEYSNNGSGYAEIGYKAFYDEKNAVGEYIGKTVFYLVSETDDNVIVDGYVSETANEYEEINTERVRGFDGSEVKYLGENDEEEEISLADNCAFIKNGVAKAEIKEADLKNEIGKILFIDNNDDGDTDVVYLNIPVVAVCDYCVDDGKKVDFRGIDGTTVSAEYDTVLYYRNSRRVLAEQMSRNLLVYCYISENKKAVRFECFTNRIQGTVEGVSNDYITISGTKYTMSKYFTNNEKSNIKVGTVGIFVFDEDMRIIASVNNEDLFSGEYYGVVLGRNQQGLEAGQIKLFTQNNEFVILNESEKFVVDGIGVQNVDFTKFTGEMVIFKTNINNEITEMFTRYGKPARIIEANIEIENAFYYGNTVFESERPDANMVFPVDKNSIVFTLPFIEDELAMGSKYEGSYSAKTFENAFKKGNNGKMIYYNVDDFQTPQIIVKKSKISNAVVGLISSAGPDVYMLEAVGEAYENDEFYTELELINVLTGEKVKRLYHEEYDKILLYDRMLVDGLLLSSTRRIPATEMTEKGKASIGEYSISVKSLKKGDIIRGQLESGSSNIFKAIDRIYTSSDFAKDVCYISYGENAPNSGSYFVLRCGMLSKIKDGKMQMSVSSDNKYYTSIYGDAKKLIVYDGNIHVHNPRELPVYVDSNSKIVILSGQGVDNAIFIYNK